MLGCELVAISSFGRRDGELGCELVAIISFV